MFKVNVAGWERAARVLLGASLLIIGWGGFATGTTATVLQWLGFVPLMTGLVGWCPLYSLLHFSTVRTKSA